MPPPAGPDLPQPHLLPAAEAHGGRQDPQQVGPRWMQLTAMQACTVYCNAMRMHVMHGELHWRVGLAGHCWGFSVAAQGEPRPGCSAAAWLERPAATRTAVRCSFACSSAQNAPLPESALPPAPAPCPSFFSVQRPRAGADPDAAAGGGSCTRWRPALWRNGARLHHLARRRRLPEGEAERGGRGARRAQQGGPPPQAGPPTLLKCCKHAVDGGHQTMLHQLTNAPAAHPRLVAPACTTPCRSACTTSLMPTACTSAPPAAWWLWQT